jgi:glycosyltransferase involved in cell wall biosynthesis
MSKVAILTGGRDMWYAIPLAEGLAQQPHLDVDVIASTQYLGSPALERQGVSVLPLHGDLSPGKSRAEKVLRGIRMYAGILAYTVRTDAQIFHILWENQFKWLDRTLLVAFYRLLGKKVVLTAHNVDADERDAVTNRFGRFCLRLMYAMLDHIVVHTEMMKSRLSAKFGVDPTRITVIPYGLNTVTTKSDVSPVEARRRLGYSESDRLILFFGNITLYKGLEYLVEAMDILKRRGHADLTLIVAGSAKDRRSQPYWQQICSDIAAKGLQDFVRAEGRFIRDDEVELFFKAADVCALPYVAIDQSGVLFMAYLYGTPVIVTDVGSLRDDVLPGKTGFVCRPRDAGHLAETLAAFFASDLYAQGDQARVWIERWAEAGHSWGPIAAIIANVYSTLTPTHVVQSRDSA